jgi:branched-chain amino acid transport system permease protein
MGQQIVNGIALGGLFGLVAVSFSLVYGIVRLINFAFGQLFMLGAYVTALLLGAQLEIFGTVFQGPNLGLAGAAIVAMLVVGALGWVVELVAYRPLRHAPPIASLITVLGVSVFLEGLGFLIFGTQERPFPGDNWLGGPAFRIGEEIVINRVQLAGLFLGLALAGGLILMVNKTLFGLKMQACAQDIRSAELQGVDSNKIIVSTFVLGSMVAAVAGAMWAALFNSLYPTMGFNPSLIALVAAVLGGIGSISGAFLGGIVLGIVQSIGVAYIPGIAGFGNGLPFAVLILLLWIKPEGLLGSATVSRPGSVERRLTVVPRKRHRDVVKRIRSITESAIVAPAGSSPIAGSSQVDDQP